MQEEVPVIDVGSFLEPDPNEAIFEKQKLILQQVSEACEEWGFFQVVNHRLNLEFLRNAFKQSKEFFGLPLEEKLKVKPTAGSSPYPTGYNNQNKSQGVRDNKELLFFFTDETTVDVSEQSYSQYNVWPEKPLNFRYVIEELIRDAEKTMKLVVALVSKSLGLPADFVYNISPQKIHLFLMHYYPPCDVEDGAQALGEHKDGGILNMVIQSDVEGYQVKRGSKWITIKPIDGALIFNVADSLQVWTNDRYKSVVHRVRSHKTYERFSFAFETTPGVHTQMAPLPQFTSEIGKPPQYRSFEYQEYLMLRLKNKSLLPNEKEVGIEDFAIQT